MATHIGHNKYPNVRNFFRILSAILIRPESIEVTWQLRIRTWKCSHTSPCISTVSPGYGATFKVHWIVDHDSTELCTAAVQPGKKKNCERNLWEKINRTSLSVLTPALVEMKSNYYAAFGLTTMILSMLTKILWSVTTKSTLENSFGCFCIAS